MTDLALTARDIRKVYDGITALDGVPLELRRGEIQAVVGENGSGKSTLLSILSGALAADGGSITVAGKTLESLDPKLARSLGIALVHQEPQLAPALTVGENLMMGRLPGVGGFVAWKRMHREAQELLDELGIRLDAAAAVSTLSTGRRQLVEIAKALVEEPRVLLLDEATSSLDDSDVLVLFALLRRLKEKGVAIAFVSHRMKEVMTLADRATVLRDGRWVGNVAIANTDEHRLVALMVGRNLERFWHKADTVAGPPVLQMTGVSRGPLHDISLTVGEGEIVGVAGLVGSGRSALMRTLVGIKPAKAGSIAIAGQPVRIRSPRAAHKLSVAYVPEDRKTQGLVLGWSILRNAALAVMNDRPPLAFITRRFDEAALQVGSRGLSIKSSGTAQAVRQLSGGNQQKVVLAREIATKPRILLLDEPTRGIDVGAKEDIYAKMAALVKDGVGILLASSELQELLGLCDRIYVMFRGRIVAELPRAAASEEAITYWSSGAHEMGGAAETAA